MKVTINAGHCPGADPGAIGQTGLQEADVAKDIAELTSCYLRQAGCETLIVQDNELSNIIDASNLFGADLFVSIHCNGFKDPAAKGTEVFCYQLLGNSEQLAKCIQSQIIDNLQTVDRGIKTGNLYVLRHTECTAVLVETAFITNSKDELLLATQQDEFAKAIARGVTDYVGAL